MGHNHCFVNGYNKVIVARLRSCRLTYICMDSAKFSKHTLQLGLKSSLFIVGGMAQQI